MGLVDGDCLVLLGLEGIQDERQLKGHVALVPHRLDGFDLVLRWGARVVKQAANQSRFAVIGVTNEGDAQPLSHAAHRYI